MNRFRFILAALACLATVVMPAPNQAQNFLCYDIADEGECAFSGCSWCRAYGVCLNKPDPGDPGGFAALCDCHGKDEGGCQDAPMCQFCGNLNVCKYDNDESCLCGNGTRDPGEECDGTAHCINSVCLCEDGYTPGSGTCVPYCGDGVMVGDENCEYTGAGPTEHCVAGLCRCEAGYVPDPAHPRYCVPQNNAPVLAPIGNKQVNQGELLQFTISATDPDTGQSLVFTVGDLPTGATFDAATGTFAWTPLYTQSGNFAVVFTVTDTGVPPSSDYEQVTITVGRVNRPPAIQPIGAIQVNEGATLAFVVSASDPDDDQVTYSAAGAPGYLFPEGATFDAQTGTFTWTPGYGQAGNYQILFTATDNGVPPESAQMTVTITVGDVNRAPTLSPIGSKTVDENVPLSFVVSGSDPDGGLLAYAVDALPEGATFDAVRQRFAWTPGYGQAGSYVLTFTVTDTGTPPLSASEQVTITVGNVNRPPALQPIGARTVNEGQALAFALSGSDPDGDSLTYSASGLPAGARFDAARGVFAWTPSAGDAGTRVVTFAVTDPGGLGASEPVTITATSAAIRAALVLNPNTLNLKSNGGSNSFTAYIELDGAARVSQIVVSSLTLVIRGVSIPAQPGPVAIGDSNGNGVPDLMVKFDRQAVIRALAGVAGQVTGTIRGTLTTGRTFEAAASIKVIN